MRGDNVKSLDNRTTLNLEKETPLKYNVYVSSHQGHVRANNEDNFIINTVYREIEKYEVNARAFGIEEPLLCAVFDGMGGEASGEVASYISAKCAKQMYKSLVKDNQSISKGIDVFTNEANRQINEMLENSTARRGGSTFALAYFDDSYVRIFSLGDSRVYLIQNNKAIQLTKDQTLANKKVEANIYTQEEAKNSPDSHKLVSFLGVDIDNQGLVCQRYDYFKLGTNDKLLLCSDGLYDMCSDEQIAQIASKDSKTVSLDLVNAALKNGGVDNVTCVVVEISKD